MSRGEGANRLKSKESLCFIKTCYEPLDHNFMHKNAQVLISMYEEVHNIIYNIII